MAPRDPLSTAFVYGLGLAVTVAWVASVFADIFIDGYGTPIALHGLMGTVVGSVFADAGLRRARQKLLEDRDRTDLREANAREEARDARLDR